MRVNPFSLFNKDDKYNPSLYYDTFLSRVFRSIFVLAGDDNHYGVLDYLFVLPLITKWLLYQVLESNSTPMLLRILALATTYLLLLPQYIFAIGLGLIFSPVTLVIHFIFKSKYEDALNQIKSLEIITDVQGANNIETSKTTLGNIQLVYAAATNKNGLCFLTPRHRVFFKF